MSQQVQGLGSRSVPGWVLVVTVLVILWAFGRFVVLDDAPSPDSPPAPVASVAAPPPADPRYTPGMIHELSALTYQAVLEGANRPGLTTAQSEAAAGQFTGKMYRWEGRVEDVIRMRDSAHVSLTVEGRPLSVEFEGEEAQEALSLSVGDQVRFQAVLTDFASLFSVVPSMKYGKIIP